MLSGQYGQISEECLLNLCHEELRRVLRQKQDGSKVYLINVSFTLHAYAAELLRPYNGNRPVRSSDQGLLTVPRSYIKSRGDRVFEALKAPKLWNNLPWPIRLNQWFVLNDCWKLIFLNLSPIIFGSVWQCVCWNVRLFVWVWVWVREHLVLFLKCGFIQAVKHFVTVCF